MIVRLSFTVIWLRQLNQYSTCAFRVDKGDLSAASPCLGALVYEPGIFFLQIGQLGADVVDTQANVMNAGTALAYIFAHRTVRRKRLQQFDVRIAGIQLGNPDPLLLDNLNSQAIKAELPLVESQCFFKVRHGDGNVIQAHPP